MDFILNMLIKTIQLKIKKNARQNFKIVLAQQLISQEKNQFQKLPLQKEVHLQSTHPLFDDTKNEVDYYFVHSFAFEAEKKNQVYSETEYGVRFPSAVGRENIFGVQFHPEKSQKNGLQILDNFCRRNGLC